MKLKSRLTILTTALAAALSLAVGAMAQTPAAPAATATPSAKATKKASTAPKEKPTAKPAPTAAEIADAQAKGMVWVNLGTKVYYKSGKYYGKTKKGEFMTEADAQKAGYKAAAEPVAKKTTTKAAPKTDTKKKS